jgi:NAD(P)-dependent dehydrogenase (short-subunit alcohol dehydrogenase family)
MSIPRSVLITGASTGIGEACALWLDGAGYRVFAGVRRTADGDRLRVTASPRLVPVSIDVTDDRSIEAVTTQIDELVGTDGLYGLVNNAGIAVAGPLELVPIADLRRQLEVNVVGQVAVTQAVLPLLRRAKGRIVLMGSIGGRMVTPFLGPYCASKFALEAIADSLRVELQPWGIHVAIVEPGSVATPIWTKSDRDAEAMQAVMSHHGADYTVATEALRKAAAAAGRRGVPPAVVAKIVAHALESPRPKTRYVVGRDAKMQVLFRLLPDRVRDRLIARALKLPRRA